MIFNKEQFDQLNAPLSTSNVKQRKQGGSSVSYIEGWHAIAECNRIFGYGNWQRETIQLNEVCRYETTSSTGKKNWKVGYEAKVRITVSNGSSLDGICVREGTGHGQGTMGDLFDAIESAAKEAETDAMKRALMTFGNQFGLALYDKERRNVEDEPKSKPIPQRPELSEEQKAAAAMEHAKIHAHAAAEFSSTDKVAYAKENAAIIERIGNYPEAREILIKAGIGIFLT